MPIFTLAPASELPAASFFPQSRNLIRQLLRRAGGIESSYLTSELMPKPGLLPLGILACVDGDCLGHRVSRSRPMQVFHRFLDADPIQSRGVRWVSLGQHCRDLLDQAAAHHLLRPAGNSPMQHRPGNRQHNVPRIERALRPGCLLPIGKWPAAEKRHFNGPRGSLSATSAKARVQPRSPPQ